MTMRSALVVAMLATLSVCNTASAQVGGMGTPTPRIGATSPLGMGLGMAPGSPIAATGIPLGSTELASPGVSPPLAGTLGMTGTGMTCPAIGSASPGMSGSSTIYDGGGMAMGTGAPLPGSTATSGTCGTSTVTSSNPPSSVVTPPGGVARAGIPLGSVEIGNAGVSAAPVVPTPGPYPSTMGSGIPCATTGLSMSPTGC
jgi:hypothetical protein